MKVIKFVKIVLFIIGLILTISAVLIFNNTNKFIQSSVVAQGVVIGIAENDRVYYPSVRFETADHQFIQFRSNTGSNPPSHAVGDKVEVLYKADSPEKAKIKTFFALWFPTMIVGGIGVMFLFVSLIIMIVQKKGGNIGTGFNGGSGFDSGFDNDFD